MTGWWWLSFADPERPAGEQFLGVAIVEVTLADLPAAYASAMLARYEHGSSPEVSPEDAALVAAVHVAHELEVNPGGEVRGFPMPPDELPPEQLRGRLLSRAELEAADLV